MMTSRRLRMRRTTICRSNHPAVLLPEGSGATAPDPFCLASPAPLRSVGSRYRIPKHSSIRASAAFGCRLHTLSGPASAGQTLILRRYGRLAASVACAAPCVRATHHLRTHGSAPATSSPRPPPRLVLRPRSAPATGEPDGTPAPAAVDQGFRPLTGTPNSRFTTGEKEGVQRPRWG
jgi:hypothetical protein